MSKQSRDTVIALYPAKLKMANDAMEIQESKRDEANDSILRITEKLRKDTTAYNDAILKNQGVGQ